MIVVHPAALWATSDGHTQVAQFDDGGPTWLGALGEDLLVTLDEPPEPDAGDPIAAPLNDASNPKWWTPVVPRAALAFPGNVKDSQVELAHAWSLPASIPAIGEVTPLGRSGLDRALRAYLA